MLKRELTKIEKYVLIILAISVCLYFYITKIHNPIYKNYKQTKTSLKTIDNEVRSLGSKPNIDQAREQLEVMEEEAQEVNDELYQVIVNNKSQTLDSAMDTLVHVNKLSLINGIEVKNIMLSSQYLKPKFGNKKDKEDENKEDENEEESNSDEEEQTQEEGQEKGPKQSWVAENSISNSFEWEVYDMRLQGGYTNIANFIDSLKNTDKIARIDYLTLIHVKDSSDYEAIIKIYI